MVLLIARWIVDDSGLPEIKEILAGGAVNWGYFNALLMDHEVYSFAYACLKDFSSLLPGNEVDLLKRTYYFNLARISCFQDEIFRIIDVYRERGVDILPLKGSAFLVDNMYGGKAGSRPMVDIDILVREDNLCRAGELLENIGYHKDLGGLKEDYWRRRNYHIVYERSNCNNKSFTLVEMHWLLDYPRKTPLLPRLWDRIITSRVENREISLLSPEDMLFCLVLHLRRFGKVLSLKSACDCALLLAKHKDLDWDYILRETRNGHMRASLYFRLVQAGMFFDIHAPDAVLKGLCLGRYKKRLIEQFILRNTFSALSKTGDSVFLKNHFLAYDGFGEPAGMILHMPLEQFGKFYRLAPYRVGTVLLYRMRFFFYPFYLFALILRAVINPGFIAGLFAGRSKEELWPIN